MRKKIKWIVLSGIILIAGALLASAVGVTLSSNGGTLFPDGVVSSKMMLLLMILIISVPVLLIVLLLVLMFSKERMAPVLSDTNGMSEAANNDRS